MPETQDQLVLLGALQPWPRKVGQEVYHQGSWFPNCVIKLPETCQRRIRSQNWIVGQAVRTETQQAGGVLQPSWVETEGGDRKLWKPSCSTCRGTSSSTIVTEASPVEMHSLWRWHCPCSVQQTTFGKRGASQELSEREERTDSKGRRVRTQV